MSKEFKNIIADLQKNPKSIASYLSDPELFLKDKNISVEEREALMARNIESLNDLGLSVEESVGALSGAHSQRCGNRIERI